MVQTLLCLCLHPPRLRAIDFCFATMTENMITIIFHLQMFRLMRVCLAYDIEGVVLVCNVALYPMKTIV